MGKVVSNDVDGNVFVLGFIIGIVLMTFMLGIVHKTMRESELVEFGVAHYDLCTGDFVLHEKPVKEIDAKK